MGTTPSHDAHQLLNQLLREGKNTQAKKAAKNLSVSKESLKHPCASTRAQGSGTHLRFARWRVSEARSNMGQQCVLLRDGEGTVFSLV